MKVSVLTNRKEKWGTFCWFRMLQELSSLCCEIRIYLYTWLNKIFCRACIWERERERERESIGVCVHASVCMYACVSAYVQVCLYKATLHPVLPLQSTPATAASPILKVIYFNMANIHKDPTRQRRCGIRTTTTTMSQDKTSVVVHPWWSTQIQNKSRKMKTNTRVTYLAEKCRQNVAKWNHKETYVQSSERLIITQTCSHRRLYRKMQNDITEVDGGEGKGGNHTEGIVQTVGHHLTWSSMHGIFRYINEPLNKQK